MRKLIHLSLCAIILMNSGCAAVFMSKNQKVTVTANKDSKIYVDGDLEGTGSAHFKTKKDGIKQVVLQTPGFKDNYAVMVANRRQGGYYAAVVCDAVLLNILYGAFAVILDSRLPKTHAYQKLNKFSVSGKISNKQEDDKFIHISSIGVDLTSKNKDITVYKINVNKSNKDKKIEKLIEEAETKKQQKDDKEKEKASKKNSKKDKERLKEEEEAVKYDDTKFSYNIFKTLKKSGFVDTVNKVFQDENNTLVLEGKITRINAYQVTNGKLNALWNTYHKAKVYLTWYIKNRYGETLDSVNAKNLSGDFLLYNYIKKSTKSEETQQKQIEKMVGDAIDNSYLELYSNPTFKKYLKSEAVQASTDEILHLNRPRSFVADKSDASLASVIIKRDDQGHGSGFAITQDGYIITNYHVIANKDNNKPVKLTVLTSTGEELETKVVRFSKANDIALLKVEKKFDKAFELSSEKQFKNLEDVYTIGAPKSIELGQTVTTGIISNERKANNNELLQLSMPVNFGNSGGPLFNNKGTLEGVIVSKLVGESTEGISFAIPAYRIPDYIRISY